MLRKQRQTPEQRRDKLQRRRERRAERQAAQAGLEAGRNNVVSARFERLKRNEDQDAGYVIAAAKHRPVVLAMLEKTIAERVTRAGRGPGSLGHERHVVYSAFEAATRTVLSRYLEQNVIRRVSFAPDGLDDDYFFVSSENTERRWKSILEDTDFEFRAQLRTERAA